VPPAQNRRADRIAWTHAASSHETGGDGLAKRNDGRRIGRDSGGPAVVERLFDDRRALVRPVTLRRHLSVVLPLS
jgi:hypothetical protein